MSEISLNTREAEAEDVSAMLDLFKKAYFGMVHVPETEYSDFEECLNGSFDERQVYKIKFFIIEDANENIVSFAGTAPCQFMNGSWELRWGTTHPDFQGQGLMTRLTEERISYAKSKNKEVPGIVQIASRQPGLYKKLGFKKIFERNIDNYVMYMIKEI